MPIASLKSYAQNFDPMVVNLFEYMLLDTIFEIATHYKQLWLVYWANIFQLC